MVDQDSRSTKPPASSLESVENQTTLTDDPIGGSASLSVLAIRSLFGGFLMGLANLVPGISGGTMLLATGVYPAFIESLSSVTRFKFKPRAMLVLGCIAVAAGLGILLLAGTLKELVVTQRWVMYSLFIGLTLGGVPLVLKLTKARDKRLFVPAAIAFLMMALLALMDYWQVAGFSGGSGFLMLALAGLAGASAMILPGLSGSYLLLLMGQYEPILGAISEFKDALKERDFAAAMDPALAVLLPVGIGVVIGIVVVGNLLKWLLNKYRTQTFGVLLGLLVGSTVGLFPFQQGVEPKIGDTVKQQVVTAESILELEEDDWPTEYFQPSILQVANSLGLVAAGFAVTMGVSLIRTKED